MMNKYIYMDTAASTKPSDNVIKEMIHCAKDIYGNPSSIHDVGFMAKEKIDIAKENISKRLSCSPDELYFTTGATMSNNLAIQGWLKANPNGVIVYSSIEHNDIMMLIKYLKKNGIQCIEIPVDKYGFVDIAVFDKVLNNLKEDNKKFLVTIQMANNEIGVIQHTSLLSNITHNYGGVYHTDATQYIAHLPIDVDFFGIDILSMSGQKIKCVKGIGLLYVRSDIEIHPIIFGEQGLIGGTENVIGISCLSVAFNELYKSNIEMDFNNYKTLLLKQHYFIKAIESLGLNIVGDKLYRLPNNICVMFKNIDGGNVVQFLNDKNIYTSTGSACSSHVDEPSHVIMALGYSDDEASSCVRFTIDDNITYDDMDYVVNMIKMLLAINY